MKKYIAILLLAMSGTADAASYLKGGILLSVCESQVESSGWSYCKGYLLAVAEITALYPGSGICVPEEPWKRDLHTIYVRYAKAHPEKMSLGAKAVVMDAFYEAFPCSKR